MVALCIPSCAILERFIPDVNEVYKLFGCGLPRAKQSLPLAVSDEGQLRLLSCLERYASKDQNDNGLQAIKVHSLGSSEASIFKRGVTTTLHGSRERTSKSVRHFATSQGEVS
eukprot:s1084_g17.t1